MSKFIHREVAKININHEEFYVCIYVHENTIVNISFFKKLDDRFEEIFTHSVSEEVRKELIQRVHKNKVEKLARLEATHFNQSLNKHNHQIKKEIIKSVKKNTKELSIEYVGEIAGLHYLVSKSNKMMAKQLYLIQKSVTHKGFEVGRIPYGFVEMVLLDYVHHVKINSHSTFLMIDELTFMGLKIDKENQKIIYVVNIELSADSISASKAYIISKKNNYEYVLLPLQDNTPLLMEGLKREGENIVHEFMKQMNLLEK